MEAILQPVAGAEKIVLVACDGTETIVKAGDVFTGYIHSDFVQWGLDEASVAIPETAVCVKEMALDATFAEMFGSLSTDLKSLCLTQAQIKKFVKREWKWLRTDGYATFFLFQKDGEFFVADVRLSSVGPRGYVHKFACGIVWFADNRLRVVVPATVA